VLPIEKIRFNFRNLVHYKDKTRNIKLSPKNNNNEDKSTKTIGSVPSLNDMEFNWIEDY
jgi:hypothetical protein